MSKEKLVRQYVASRMHRWQAAADSSKTRGELAQLRRELGKTPGEIPETWGLLFDGCPEELMSRDGEPTRAEWAIATALSMYALHQQGYDPVKENMNLEGRSIGSAVRLLAPLSEDPDLERVRKRFNVFATSSDMGECSHHLRGLIQLLRTKGIKLDYPQLASDLYQFQILEGAKRVKLKWGQDFYRSMKQEEKESEE